MGQGGYAARTVHSNTDPHFLLWQSFLDRQDFRQATDLCRERKMLARDASGCVRWAKDSAIVDAMQGRFVEAFEQLAAVNYVAQGLRGRPRAKYEDELGLVLVEFGRTSLALSHFRLAIREHRRAGYLRGVAAVRNNAARALHTRGETEKAGRYLMRALTYARKHNDFRLEFEILESMKEFGGIQ